MPLALTQLNYQPCVQRQRRLRVFGTCSAAWDATSQATDHFGDNLSIILNSHNPAADLSKKHVAISFHVVREAVAAGVVEPYWLKGEYNTDSARRDPPTLQILVLAS